MNTYDPVKHEYRIDDVKTATVTEVIGIYFDTYGCVPESVLKVAGDFGRNVHSMCEMWMLQTLDLDALDPLLGPYLNGFLKFHAEKIGADAVETEKKMFSKRLMLSGILDIETPDAIHDIKTRKYNKKTDPLQLAAYDKLAGGNGSSKAHYVVEILPNDYKLTQCNDRNAWPVFKQMLDHFHATKKLENIIDGWRKR